MIKGQTVEGQQTQSSEQATNDKNHNGTENSTPPTTDAPSIQPETDTFGLLSKSVEGFIIDILQKTISWITYKIKFFLGKNGLYNILQTLLSSFISSSN